MTHSGPPTFECLVYQALIFILYYYKLNKKWKGLGSFGICYEESHYISSNPMQLCPFVRRSGGK